MRFVLLTCASAQEDWAEKAISNYVAKIKPFVTFEVKNLKLKKSGRDDALVKKRSDSDQILKEIEDSDTVVLFDEKGDAIDSKAFSQKVNLMLQSGKKRVVWIIGGPLS